MSTEDPNQPPRPVSSTEHPQNIERVAPNIRGSLDTFQSQLGLSMVGDAFYKDVVQRGDQRFSMIEDLGVRALAGAILFVDENGKQIPSGVKKVALKTLAQALAAPGYNLIWPESGTALTTQMERVGAEGPTHTVGVVVSAGLSSPIDGQPPLIMPKVIAN
jgi:hypothetical protein